VFFTNRARNQRPVTTTPKPFMVKTRSIGSRARAVESLDGTSAAASTRACFRSSRPAPVSALTATTEEWAGSRNEWRQKTLRPPVELRQSFAIHQVGFGSIPDAARDRKQAADIEMLAGLRLD